MKKITKITVIIALTAISLVTGVICHEQAADAKRIKIKPGSSVFDPLRYAQQVLSNAQKTAINSNHLSIIQNQFKDLKSIGQEFLGAFLNSTSDILKAHDEAAGALGKTSSAEQVMDSKFKVLNDEEFLSGAFVEDEKARRAFLSDTCKDAYKNTSYIMQNFDKKLQNIEMLNTATEKGEGNLAQQQIKNMQAVEQIQADIASMQMQSNLASIKILHRQSHVVLEGLSRRRGQNLQQISFDPYNPTPEDERIYTKKPAQGFIQFK